MLLLALLGQGSALVFTAVSPGPTTIVARAQFVEQTAKAGPSPGAGRNPRAAGWRCREEVN